MQNGCIRACFTVAKWFPVFFISAVVVWSYYAYVIELCAREVQSHVEKAFYLIFYHIFLILFAWSYFQCIMTDGGKIPSKFFLTSVQLGDFEAARIAKDFEGMKRLLEKYARDLPVQTRGYNGDIRYCEKCMLIKPDRAHHCSICERCILKMDHHCPWVNNCVNFNNYKFFILFLGYAVIYCLFISLTDLQYFIKFWKDELSGNGNRFHILFLFFVSSMFMISLISLLGYHAYLTLTNRSTIESYRAPVFVGGTDRNGFNIGKGANFTEIFGRKKLLWFLPVFTSKGDGLSYPSNSARSCAYGTAPALTQPPAPPPHQRNSAQLQQHHQILIPDIPLPTSEHNPSQGRGVTFPVRQRPEDSRDLLEDQQKDQWRRFDEPEGFREERPAGSFNESHGFYEGRAFTQVPLNSVPSNSSRLILINESY